MTNYEWEALRNTKGDKCIIWEYDKEDDSCVIYRFVWKLPQIAEDNIIFYIGSGLNLSSNMHKTKSLKYQYIHGNRIEKYTIPIQDELKEKRGRFGQKYY
jgi:hypothetical protein